MVPGKRQRQHEAADGEKQEDADGAPARKKGKLVLLDGRRKIHRAMLDEPLARVLQDDRHDGQKTKPVHQRQILAIGSFSFK